MNWRQQRSSQGEVTALLWWFFIKSRQNKMLAVHISATHSCHWNHMNIKCVWADFLSGGGAATARCLRRHVNICTCDTTGCFSGHYSSVICNEMDILGHFQPYLCHKSGYFWENLETFPAEVMATKTRYFCQDVGKFPAVFVATEPGVFNVTSGRLQQFFVEIFLRKCWNIYSLIWH